MRRVAVHLPSISTLTIEGGTGGGGRAAIVSNNGDDLKYIRCLQPPRRSCHTIVMNTFNTQTGSTATATATAAAFRHRRLVSTSTVLGIERGGDVDGGGGGGGDGDGDGIDCNDDSNEEYISNDYQKVYIAVGSNMGDRYGNIMNALTKLEESTIRDDLGNLSPQPPPKSSTTDTATSPLDEQSHPLIRNIRTSFLRETPPMYLTDQPSFLNGAVELQTRLSPHALLRRLKSIERRLGRDLDHGVRNGPRPVDLDILLYTDGTTVASPRLQVPHPRINEREFVLQPLLDLDHHLEQGTLTLQGQDGTKTVGHMLRDLLELNEPEGGTGGEDAVHVLPLPRGRMLGFRGTVVMGILNATPDSFSDGGKYVDSVDVAVEHALRMVEDGAGIIDIGGESTRPGAKEVATDLELDRVIPVIQKLREGK